MTEYQKGFASGKQHGNHIPGVLLSTAKILYLESKKKIQHVKNDNHAAKAVKEYWRGYEDGMNSRITP